VNGVDTIIRTIALEQDGSSVDVTLWRDHAERDIKPGQFLKVSRCLVNEWQGTKSLNSTRNSSVEVLICKKFMTLNDIIDMYTECRKITIYLKFSWEFCERFDGDTFVSY
jgi:hypothetical protein